MELVPQAREIVAEAAGDGRGAAARQAAQVIDEILARPEHAWFEKGADEKMDAIRRSMEERYGQGEADAGAP